MPGFSTKNRKAPCLRLIPPKASLLPAFRCPRAHLINSIRGQLRNINGNHDLWRCCQKPAIREKSGATLVSPPPIARGPYPLGLVVCIRLYSHTARRDPPMPQSFARTSPAFVRSHDARKASETAAKDGANRGKDRARAIHIC